ncbi:membrane protein of unknown function [Candidatus Promineifilum breve]|uniref:Protein-glutamine gamma-glutamyltransferase-like C-terminal domain-containing protein n=1 Tax=Candidatus Promineifilum breve TaxID=1806508 RepID=A0A160T1Q6_9CHLR|nr:DUF4129 domain-containing protein [Candidatus Promineifilum breve]CUS02465.1 membrane protein of unknown function [Candidatus Promineifilum breve]
MSTRRRRTIRNKGVIAAARLRRAPEPGERLIFRTDPLTRRFIRPLLITLLATSVSVALLVILRIATPEMEWMLLVPLCFLAALEGTYTAAWLSNPDSRAVDRGVYRAAEVLLLIVIARVYSWIVFGQGIPSPDEMRLFLTAPLAVLSVAGFVSTTVVTLIAWWLAVTVSRIFVKLDASAEELNFYTLSPAEQKAQADNVPIQVAREELLRNYTYLWLNGGMVMVVVAALSTFEVNQFANVINPFEITRLGLSAAMLLALMTYFLVGFWLLSHARLLRMNARWLMDGAAKDAGVERGWQRSSFAILAIIALVAAFLPIGSTLAISRILSAGLAGLGYLASRVFALISYWFVSALLWLTRNAEDAPLQPLRPTPPPPPVAPPPPLTATNPITSMVISSAFWALVIAIIIAALLFFLRERGYRVDTGRLPGYWAAATAWLRAAWARLTGRARAAGRGLQARFRGPGDGPPPPPRVAARPRFLRLGGLSPREQVRFYYLSLVRRATERGVNRQDSATPLEYTDQLRQAWPEAEDDIEELTQSFLAARYSPQPIEKGDALTMKERWNRVRNRLRGRK